MVTVNTTAELENLISVRFAKLGETAFAVALKEGATVGETIEAIKADYPKHTGRPLSTEGYSFAVNGHIIGDAELSDTIEDGDIVTLVGKLKAG